MNGDDASRRQRRHHPFCINQVIGIRLITDGGAAGCFSGLLAGKNPLEGFPWGRGAKGRGFLAGFDAELTVVFFDVSFQKDIGIFPGRDSRKAHFDDQAVLQSLPEPLDSSLGLWRSGFEVRDAQVFQGSADLAQGLGFSRQFVFKGHAFRGRGYKDGMAV